jgi:hypothetical protein
MKYLAPKLCAPSDELLEVAATIGTKRKANAFRSAVNDVVQQVSPVANYQTAHWQANTHPGLQVADYCSWAVQRKWEHHDPT